MYHSSVTTSRTTSSRLRNNRVVVISARRADRAAVICCCWVARRAVTCMRPHSSQHSISVAELHDATHSTALLHWVARAAGCECVSVSRRTGSEGVYRICVGRRRRQTVGRVGRTRSLLHRGSSQPTCDASPKNTTPVCGARVRSPPPGLDETSTVILYHAGLQPASFARPALSARHEAAQARRTTSASLNAADGGLFGCRRASPKEEAGVAGRQAY